MPQIFPAFLFAQCPSTVAHKSAFPPEAFLSRIGCIPQPSSCGEAGFVTFFHKHPAFD